MNDLSISIITPSLNQSAFIEDAITSVLQQEYDNFEHIIIDGGSRDQTKEVLMRYPHIRWISEKDDGQAQAVNKGFRLSNGNIIGWLNSDDIYQPGTFAKVNQFFKTNEKIDFIFSNCHITDKINNITGNFMGKNPNTYPVRYNRNFIPQPTVFFRRVVFTRTGYLNERYHMSMDFDYWRRIARNHRMFYINDYFACFREHENSKTSCQKIKFKGESRHSFFHNGGCIFTPYYFETFIAEKTSLSFLNHYFFKFFFYLPNYRVLFARLHHKLSNSDKSYAHTSN